MHGNNEELNVTRFSSCLAKIQTYIAAKMPMLSHVDIHRNNMAWIFLSTCDMILHLNNGTKLPLFNDSTGFAFSCTARFPYFNDGTEFPLLDNPPFSCYLKSKHQSRKYPTS